MNIVFMGTPDFAVGSLKALHEAGHTITGVVTQPDRPKGRKKEPAPCAVKMEAEKLGLPVYQPARVRNPEAIEHIREMKPDLIVVAAFGQIIPKEILDLPEYGCINVHASLLPAYRGAAPIQHAILDGLDETGVTIMLMNEGLDTGDILASRTVPITPDTTGGSLFDQLAKEGASLLAETIPGIVSGSIHPTPQPEKSTTPYASMISKNMGRIDWTKDAVYIERLVRAMDPWPSAWTYLDGKILKIWKAHVEKTDLQGDEAHTGKVVRQDARGFYIQTGIGILVPEEVQIEGRKRMTAAEFLRGFIIRDNDLTKEPENSRV